MSSALVWVSFGLNVLLNGVWLVRNYRLNREWHKQFKELSEYHDMLKSYSVQLGISQSVSNSTFKSRKVDLN